MQNLEGTTAVITGGASGIGLAMAHEFGAAGMKLMLADVEVPALSEAESALRAAGYEVASMEVDVRDMDQIRALEAATRERFGNVHVLCNNAGVGTGGPVADPDDIEVWRWTIDVNLWGVIYGCKVFLPAMLAHGEPGHVVNTASMAGHVAAPMMGAYSVSKYGVVALSETLAKEMQMTGSAIGVSVLCPAFVQTGIGNSQRNLPEEVALVERQPTEGELAVQGVIEAMVAQGIDTSIVSTAVIEAVRNNDFWILTHPETRDAITQRADDIVTGVNPNPALGMT